MASNREMRREEAHEERIDWHINNLSNNEIVESYYNFATVDYDLETLNTKEVAHILRTEYEYEIRQEIAMEQNL